MKWKNGVQIIVKLEKNINFCENIDGTKYLLSAIFYDKEEENIRNEKLSVPSRVARRDTLNDEFNEEIFTF